MVRLKKFSFIVLLCVLHPLVLARTDHCTDTQLNVDSMEPDFGGIDPFYNMAKGISDGLQSTPNQKTYNDLNDLIFGNNGATYDQVIKDLVLNQIGAIVFWSFGFVFVLAALVLGIATGIWQCCYSCVPKEGSVRSKYTGYVYCGLLFTLFSLSLTGTILFNITESKLTDSIDNAMDYTGEITLDLSGVLLNGTQQLVCEVNSTTAQTFTQMNALIGNYSTVVVDGVSESVGLTAVNDFQDNVMKAQTDETIGLAINLGNSFGPGVGNKPGCDENGKIKGQLVNITITLAALGIAPHTVRISPELKKVNDEIVNVKNNINSNTPTANQSITNAQQQISNTVLYINKMLDDIQHEITNVVNTLQSGHRDLMSSGGYNAVKIIFRIFVTLPAVLGCAFALFALFAIKLSLDERDGIALKLAPWVLVTFYTSIVLAIILLLLSSLAFVGGWFMSALCVPTFEDPQYHLFHLMNNTIPPQTPGGPSDTVNIGDLLEQCQDPSTTLFAAINGSILISGDTITNQLNLTVIRDNVNSQILQQPNQTYSFNISYQNDENALQNYLTEAQQTDVSQCPQTIQDLVGKYTKSLKSSIAISEVFINNLQTLANNAPNVSTIATEKNNEQFASADQAINASISTLMTNLQTNVFKCQPLVKIYNNGGFVLCQQFGKPIQGLWASVGLCGVVLFFLSILLLLTYRWLKKGDEFTIPKQNSGSAKTKKSKSNKKKSKDQEKENEQPSWESAAADEPYGNRQLGNPTNSAERLAGAPAVDPLASDIPPTATATTPHRYLFTSPNGSTGRRLPRIQPVEQPVSYVDYDPSSPSYYPRGVQVLPDSRHPPMSPNFYDTQEYGTRSRFDDVDLFGGDHQSNNGSTARGLRRF